MSRPIIMVARVRNLKICLLAMLLSTGTGGTGASALGVQQKFGVGLGVGSSKCEPSPTTASGTHVAHTGPFCSGELIFEDTFDAFDVRRWQHENTLSGGGNWEFQWYTNNRSNSFCEEGFLHIRPTLTADVVGDAFLTSGRLEVNGGTPAEACTNAANWGCERVGTPTHPLNPIRSARLRTLESFAFKYGKVEVSAKLPAGDWLWPAIWLLPRDNAYGTWPASGEIDLVESRGNRELLQNGASIGADQMTHTVHFGPYAGNSQGQHQWLPFERTAKPAGTAWSSDLHRYQMEWSPEKITFSVDDVETATVPVAKGFWSRGAFDEKLPGVENPWRHATPMAPFDQEFYMVINLAVGGIAYFPDDSQNGPAKAMKPWSNVSPMAGAEFWAARNEWLPTWNHEQNLSRESSLIVDYVRIWAL